jgi:uncharacterized LabA/DUF88 family protein
MAKVIFFVDGFNVYHSIIALQRDSGSCTKWLDLSSLCASYLHHFGRDATLEAVLYYTAVPYYLNRQDKINRHELYISCLESTGVTVKRGRFKEKEVFCQNCRSTILKHEEKETDVAIGVDTYHHLSQNLCDIAVLITGDTDLSPAIRLCQQIYPQKQVLFIFPYKRKNKELAKLAPASFSISKKQYIRHQFPNPLTLPTGPVQKPTSWQ